MKELGHLKLVHLFVSATFGAVTPYLPVLFICNGIGFLKSGILLSLPPFIGLFSRPVLMTIIERFAFFKTSLLAGIALNAFMLLLIQTVHTDYTCHHNADQNMPSSDLCFIATDIDHQIVTCQYATVNQSSLLTCCSEMDRQKLLNSNDQMSKCHEMALTSNQFVSRTEAKKPNSCRSCFEMFRAFELDDAKNKSCNEKQVLVTNQHESSPFVQYLVIMTAYSLFSCVVLPVLDTLTVQFCRNLPDSDFNMLKLWATAGFGGAALLSSILLSFTDYLKVLFLSHTHTFFIPFALFSIICLMLITYFQFPNPTPSAQLNFGLSTLIQSSESFVFILIVVILGCMSGIHSVFFVLYLLQINAYYILIGVAFSMYAALDLVLYFSRRRLVFMLGSRAVVYFALLAYSLRFYIYSVASNAFFIIPVELLHAMCFSCMWYACMDMASQIAPVGLSSAFQTLISNAYWHIGVGFGAVIGGAIYEEFGYKVLWRSAALFSMCSAIIFALFMHFVHPILLKQECIRGTVNADTQDFFEDDLDDLLDNDVIGPFHNFTSDEEYLILDAPGDYSIVNSRGERFVTPVRDPTGETIAAANRGQFNYPNNGANVKVLTNDDKFTIEDINV